MPDINTVTFISMAIIFVGAFVQTSIGFGMAIVSAPLLIQISPEFVPVPIVIVGFYLSLLNAMKYRSNIAIGGLKTAIMGRIPGSVVGAGMLLYVSTATLSLWLGIFVLLALLISVLPFRLEPTAGRMAVAGFFSGFMGTSSGIGGPPMALLLQHQEANSLRGNLSAFFLFSSAMSFLIQVIVGYVQWQHVWLSLPLLPATWLGYRAALLCVDSMPKAMIRYGALLLCLVSGVSAIYSALH